MPKIKLAEKAVDLIREICAKFNNDEGELINVLHQVQSKLGYLPAEVQEVIARELNISVAKVYGVVTFYSFFYYVTQGTAPDFGLHGDGLLCSGSRAGFKRNQTTTEHRGGRDYADGRFSLSCLRCVGACGLAPVVMVGEKVYGRVSPQQVHKIIAEYKEAVLPRLKRLEEK
jgi:NADH-quinone oxidoreductase subunit E/NADP-reducing hydrogenase subunit HndA